MTFVITYVIIIIALVIGYKRYLNANGHTLQLSEVFTGFL